MVIRAIKIDRSKNEHDFLHFINGNKADHSFHVVENDDTIINMHSDVRRPLASVVKIIILIAFAKQVEKGYMTTDEPVSLDHLAKYYIPRTDGGAHTAWLNDIEKSGLVTDNTVTLLDITKGMIQYSSNANTEYLIERLGIEKINHVLDEWHISEHDKVYPVSSAMLIPGYLKYTQQRSWRDITEYLENCTYEQYAELAVEVFQLLQDDRDGQEKWINKLAFAKGFSKRLQKIWSDHLPKATAKQYVNILRELFEGQTRSPSFYSLVQHALTVPVKNKNFITFAQKGGSSLFILNIVLFIENTSGTKYYFALFLNDATGLEMIWLQDKLSLFINQFFNDEQFKQVVITGIN